MALFFSSAYAESKNPKIVVVGAGLAGLTTAYRLQQQGIDVHVYEARNRVGGRILSATIQGSIAELGGQYLTDGGDAENILRLVKEFNLGIREYRISLEHSYFSGDELIPIFKPIQFDSENLKTELDALKQTAKNMRQVMDALFDRDDPLYKTLAVRLAGYEGAPIDRLSSSYVETLYHMLLGGVAAAYADSGDAKKELPLFSLKNGNAQLPESLGKSLGDHLHLNKPLKQVAKQSDGSYLLTFTEDEKVQADILVLAIPCSTYCDITFEDGAIPQDRLEAIKTVQYGTNAKIIVPFSEPTSERRCFFDDHVGCFLDIDNHLLTMYYTGETSRFSEQTLSESYAQHRPLIEASFEQACPSFIAPAFAKDQAFVSYETPVGYSWPQDPFAKGSYSYIAHGQDALLTAMQDHGGETVKTLFAPIDQAFYFAGEHTSILLDIPGTMEAACESGERTARMIAHSILLLQK